MGRLLSLQWQMYKQQRTTAFNQHCSRSSMPPRVQQLTMLVASFKLVVLLGFMRTLCKSCYHRRRRTRRRPGMSARIVIPRDGVHVFDPGTGENLTPRRP